MANRFIDSEMWNDSKFADDFTPEDKFFWLMLLTTRYGNLAGCFQISKKQMANDTGYNEQTIDNLLYRFINIHKIIDYDYETKEILILNWHKYNWTKSPKFKVSLDKFVEKIKNEKFKNHIIKSYEIYSSDTVSIPYQYDTSSISISSSIRNSISNSKDLKEIGKEKDNAKSKRFVKPTLEELVKYMEKYYIPKSKREPMANKFLAHYETVGWKVGKNTMISWKSGIAGWLIRDGYKEKPEEVQEIEREAGMELWKSD